MKRTYLIIIAIIFTTSFMACNNNDSSIVAPEDSQANNGTTKELVDSINSLPTTTLSDSEKDGLVFMREEEKLARDVYLHFYEKYNTRVFSNIAKAESTHMAALKTLLDKYQLVDPVVDDNIGVFQNEKLAGLYTQLTTAGDVSLVEALKIGLTIEDLDIYDLMEYTKDVTSDDIILVYNNLTRGSRNHLRAFNRQVLRSGGTYAAQFITQELFDEIINSSQERGGGW